MMPKAGGPNYAECFGHYRAQPVQYALAHCLQCPKMKACVRTTWGVDRMQRTRKPAWQTTNRRGLPRRKPQPAAPALDLLPT